MKSREIIKPLGIYVHIPFCVRKCRYCDFYSVSAEEAEKRAYVKQLCQEISSFPSAGMYRVQTIFIGGGTPSVLLAQDIAEILHVIRDKFDVVRDAEVTIETNPGTLDEKKLSVYRESGINRVSLGLQSCKDGELRRLGRIHTYEDFLESYDLVRRAGFQNVNIDLMSGLPGQTLRDWEDTLGRVITLKPEHISAYGLILEEGTPLYDVYAEKHVEKEKEVLPGKKPAQASDSQEAFEYPLPTEEEERRMYYRTRELLKEAGYERYEISNYAREGYECRHNYAYWIRQEYLGFGVAAASLLGNVRLYNCNCLSEYMKQDFRKIRKYEERTVLSKEDEMSEFMFLGLRTMRGIEEKKFLKEFGVCIQEIYGDVIEKYKKQGLLLEHGGRIFLSECGIDVSNVVMADFLL